MGDESRSVEHGIKSLDWICIWLTIFFVGKGLDLW